MTVLVVHHPILWILVLALLRAISGFSSCLLQDNHVLLV
jgi:hypothetical protein